MKTKTFSKTVVVSFVFAAALIASSSHAGTRQKPPVASVEMSVWYQPVLDFFNF